jgi:hypothetical protein
VRVAEDEVYPVAFAFGWVTVVEDEAVTFGWVTVVEGEAVTFGWVIVVEDEAVTFGWVTFVTVAEGRAVPLTRVTFVGWVSFLGWVSFVGWVTVGGITVTADGKGLLQRSDVQQLVECTCKCTCRILFVQELSQASFREIKEFKSSTTSCIQNPVQFSTATLL